MKRCKLLLLIGIVLMITPPLPLTPKDRILSTRQNWNTPYKYIQNGYLTGFDIDLTSMIFEKKDYLLLYSTGEWESTYSLLTEGMIDTTGLMAITEARKQDTLFSRPVLRSYISVYSRQELSEEVKLSTLKNYRIGVGKEQYSETVLQNSVGIPSSQYIEYATVPEAVEALRKGEIDLLFENQGWWII